MQSRHGTEQRKSPRVSTDASALISFNGTVMVGRIKNVSAQAFCVAIELQLAVGSAVQVVIMHGRKPTLVHGYVTRSSSKEIVVSSAEKSLAALRTFYRSLLAA